MTFSQMLTQAILNAVALIMIVVLAVIIIYSYYKSKKEDDVSETASRLIIEADKIDEDKAESPLSSDSTDYYHDLIRGLKHLISDDEIEEVILKIDKINLSSVQVEELRPIFKQIRENKKVIALATNLDKTSYQTALLADEIYLLDTNNANLSLRAHVFSDMYVKNLLTKLGIKLNAVHIGDYKVAGENYSRETMSENRRKSLEQTGHGLLNYLVNLIKEERGIEVEEEILNGDLVYIDRHLAKNYGLIDGEKSEKELRLNEKDENISFSQYLKRVDDTSSESSEDADIAVLYLEGNITPKSTSSTYISLDNVKEKIKQIKKDESIKGLVLRVNSPGGSALESELIYRELKELDIPIYASMGDYAASGGYYISSACQKIYASENTLTGSIGVVALLPELEEATDKIGVKVETVSIGEGSNFLNVFEEQNEKSKELFMKSLKDTYREFKDRVIESRGIGNDELEKIAGGRVWLGQEAVENGLVDEIKSIDQVIKQMADDLEIKKPKIKVYREKKSLKDITSGFNLASVDEVVKANTGIMYLETINIK